MLAIRKLWLHWSFLPLRYFTMATDFDIEWLNKFTDWFGSVQGFKQQTAFMLGWIIVDILNPHVDPGMLHLMVFLTIYSGITQPMLAIGNARSAELLFEVLEKNNDSIEHMEILVERSEQAAERSEKAVERLELALGRFGVLETLNIISLKQLIEILSEKENE